ncbi:hypothetical protein [Pseudomonas sp. Pseusp97]|uniref:hypothetical protein n=1 Tax=Pseudomonas sp. Pseusp97 TaxID=3243065 RepID=UPI0039A545CC
MRGKYRTVFILPLKTEKILTDYGWEFSSPEALSVVVKEKVLNDFGLDFQGEHAGIEKYIGEKLEVLFFYGSTRELETIMFKLYEDDVASVQAVWEGGLMNFSEIFIPV